MTVELAVFENASVLVEAEGEEGLLALEFFYPDCTSESEEPRASTGEVACRTLTVPVTLDNRRSSSTTTFGIAVVEEDVFDEEGYVETVVYEETVNLPPGVKQVVSVPVANQSVPVVAVTEGPYNGPGQVFVRGFYEVFCERVEGRDVPRFTPQGASVLSGRVGSLAATGGGPAVVLSAVALGLLATGGLLTLLGRRD
jgi:hypothetical protein